MGYSKTDVVVLYSSLPYPFQDSIQQKILNRGPKGAYVIPPAIVETPTSFLQNLFHALSTNLCIHQCVRTSLQTSHTQLL